MHARRLTKRRSAKSRTAAGIGTSGSDEPSDGPVDVIAVAGAVGSDEDKEAVATGTTLGKASLTEMESDLAAVDGLKSSVLVKLQELSIKSDTKAPVRRVRVSEFFSRPIQTQAELDKAMELIRDSLQKCIDEGAVIILE